MQKTPYIIEGSVDGGWRQVVPTQEFEDTGAAKKWLATNGGDEATYRIVSVRWQGSIKVSQKTTRKLA